MRLNIHRSLRICVVVMAAFVVSGGSLTRVTARSVSFEPCTLMCAQAVCPLQGFHMAWTPQSGENPNGSEGGGAHPGICYDITCISAHPCSPGGEPLMSQTESAIDSGDIETLLRLVSENPDLLVPNRERAAIQIRDCHGALSAHFPLSAEVVNQIVGSHR